MAILERREMQAHPGTVVQAPLVSPVSLGRQWQVRVGSLDEKGGRDKSACLVNLVLILF